MRTCNCCGGQASTFGSLGYTRHYRCRDCGAQFSKETRPRKKPFGAGFVKTRPIHSGDPRIVAGQPTF